MKQKIIYPVMFALLVGLGSFGVSQAYAQPLSCAGCPQVSGLPTTTNEDVLSRIMDGINTLISDITGFSSTNHSDLQTIIKNQATEIQNQQTEIGLLEKLVPQTVQPTFHDPTTGRNCHPQGTGVLCG